MTKRGALALEYPGTVGGQPDGMVTSIRAGDARAFEELVRSTHADLIPFAARYTGDRERAEELVQDLFLDLWRTRSSWDVRGSLRCYLFGALRNRALNLRRRDALERGWATGNDHEAVLALHAPHQPADAVLLAEEQRDAVQAAFDTLPERCRLVMHLRWRDGLAYSEIADVLGITPKSVENHIARGLKAMRARVLTG